MRKLWIWLGLVVIGIAAALFFGRSRVETGSVNRPWPLGLGMIADAQKRFPVTKDNAGAAKLIELARKAQVDLQRERDRGGSVSEDTRHAFAEYLETQLQRGTDAIDPPATDVQHYLTDNAAVLEEIKALALSGEPIVFASDINKEERDAPGPNLVGLQHLHRVFIVRALLAAKAGNAGAWDELQVAWKLVGPLWQRPDSMAVTTASSGARMLNTAARKLPLPPAPWFREVLTFNYERALAASQQAEAFRAKTPAFNARVRGMAEEVLRVRACDSESAQFDEVRRKLGARATPSLINTWERFMRFRAERELTERVFAMRAGKTPAKESQCSDGSWQVAPGSIRFSRDVPVRPPQIKYALEYTTKVSS
ncbi:MAG TPA: hypothetical protein VM733_02340 [Thermoanaerobaculia bacterium]|nr:hypothetical protein [Thermoanaerobaculia bacterium]